LHRKADVFFRQKEYDKARVYYEKAVSANNYGPSKRRLVMLDKMKKNLNR
jgi:hypothetical protein